MVDFLDKTPDEGLINSLNQEAEATNPNQGVLNTLSGFEGTSAPQLTIGDVAAPQNDYEKQILGDAAKYYGTTPVQEFSTYYPSMMNNIVKGSMSGSMIGSHNTYAPAALYPFGLVDARQNALKAAADKKAAEMESYKNKIMGAKAPTTKHRAVQEQISSGFYSGVSDWVEKARKAVPNGDPYKWLEQNIDFQRWKQGFNDLAAYEDQGADVVAKYEKDISEGRFVETPETKRLVNDWYKGTHATLAMNPDTFKQAEAINIFKLKGIMDANKLAEEVGKSIPQASIDKIATSSEALYDVLTTTTTKSADEQAVVNATKSSYNTHFRGPDGQPRADAPTYEEYAKMVAARVAGPSTEIKRQTVSTKDEGGLGFVFDPNAVEEEDKDIEALGERESKVAGKEGKAERFTYGIPSTAGYSLPKKVSATLAFGGKWFDVGDSQGGFIPKKQTSGAKAVEIGEVRSVPVYRNNDPKDPNSKYNGMILPKQVFDRISKEHPERINYETYAVGNFIGDEAPAKGGEAMQKTVLIPIDEVEGSIMQRNKSGKITKGVDVPFLKKKAEEATAKLRANKPAAAAATVTKTTPAGKQTLSVAAFNKQRGTNFTAEQFMKDPNFQNYNIVP